ncbi:MAG: hypothetical protein OER78_03925 [Nitrosopumilus sp.]|nr:hypothetical protein [Nitrosopumilus sp.]
MLSLTIFIYLTLVKASLILSMLRNSTAFRMNGGITVWSGLLLIRTSSTYNEYNPE